jgi:transcription-repair coupling factor (superfamily II helicase)
MEEVDNLFAIASLRIIASHSNIRKAELNKRTLRLFLPLEEDKHFYESGEFQKVMASVAAIKEPQIQLKQEGKNLFLQTFLKNNEGVERVSDAMTIIERLTA